MEWEYFDAHTHVQFAVFQDDYAEVISRALKAGVGLLNVGTQKDTSLKATEIAREFVEEPIYATVGLHPIHTDKSYRDEKELGGGETVKAFTSRGEEFDYDYYKRLASDPKVLAIGECGFDYYRLADGGKVKQKRAFLQQIELAKELGKPLMIHCRQAFVDLIDFLIANRRLLNTLPGVIHFFSGTKEDARKLLELGFSFTFGGVITFVRDYDETIRYVPLDRILSETDAPYVAPAPHRGKRNEPFYVIEVVKKLSEIKGIPTEEMTERISENTRGIFHLK